uniref:Peroxidase n=1 Tax=Phallusia mammillata TaxID=59560 RepID=A0A6F9DB57_9ASCI|nr:peroxidase [Phallusia mammillata]
MLLLRKTLIVCFCTFFFLSTCQAQSTPATIDLFGRFDRFNFFFEAVVNTTTVAPGTVEPTAEGRQSSGFPFVAPGFPQPSFVIDDVHFHSCPTTPACPDSKTKFYQPDGTCNNLVNFLSGSANTPLTRLLPPEYADKKGSPRISSGGGALPSARVISTTMQDDVIQRSGKFTQEVPFWGQFIVHDMVSTPSSSRPSGVNCRCGSTDPACFNIPIGFSDFQFIQERKTCLPVVRSQPIQDLHCSSAVRQQLNEITSFIDGSTLYGSDKSRLDELKDSESNIGSMKIGKLSPHGFVPSHSPILPLGNQVSDALHRSMACPAAVHKPRNAPCFVAGDIRANENQVLSSHHTLFLRLHNNIVQDLSQKNRHWGADKLFETARSIVAALNQVVTYGQFLPVVLGPTYMKRFGLELNKEGYYHGYDASYDATVANSFATAAFRFGHTLVPETLTRYSPHWSPTGPSLKLRDSFFNNEPLLSTQFGGANSVLRGTTQKSSLTFDTTFAADMHNNLFAPPGRIGHDLLAINIQRGRDHGLPGYNHFRVLAGLKKARKFSDFVEIPFSRRNTLQKLYKNRVDDVDLYIGGLSESSVSGGIVGPTMAYIIGHQFRALKRGDRFWFENGDANTVFTPGQLKTLRKMSLSKLICDQMGDTRTMSPNPFLQPTVAGNARKPCTSFSSLDLNQWKDGRANALDKETDTEFTPWFALTTEGGKKIEARELLDFLLLNRPDDVCPRVLGSEKRSVFGKNQIRFKCSPGTIKGSPYPPADVKMGVWTDWEDSSTPTSHNGDDDESRGKSHKCKGPIAIQVQTTKGVPARETGEVFRKHSPFAGFLCRKQDQQDGRCLDYKVRYLCKEIVKGPISDGNPTTAPPKTKPTAPSGFKWSPWVSFSNPAFGDGDREFIYLVYGRTGFCATPTKMEARDVVTKQDSRLTGDTFQIFSPRQGLYCANAAQSNFVCHDYEVRYLCKEDSK